MVRKVGKSVTFERRKAYVCLCTRPSLKLHIPYNLLVSAHVLFCTNKLGAESFSKDQKSHSARLGEHLGTKVGKPC